GSNGTEDSPPPPCLPHPQLDDGRELAPRRVPDDDKDALDRRGARSRPSSVSPLAKEIVHKTSGTGAREATRGVGDLSALSPRLPAPRASRNAPVVAAFRGVEAAAVRGSAVDLPGAEPPGRHAGGLLPPRWRPGTAAGQR